MGDRLKAEKLAVIKELTGEDIKPRPRISPKRQGKELRPIDQMYLRTKIKAGVILQRLQAFANGETKIDEDGNIVPKVEMSALQVSSSFKLLDKVLSNQIQESVDKAHQAIAHNNLQDSQLKAMALEYLRQNAPESLPQGHTIEGEVVDTLPADPVQDSPTIPPSHDIDKGNGP